MTDEQFKNELVIRCFQEQIAGYYLGHPRRTDFEPMVPMIYDENGSLNRERTLESYPSFTKLERALLLDHGDNWRGSLKRARASTGEDS